VRRLYYNVTVTTLSIVVALGIGSLELLAVAADRFGLTGGLFGFASRVDLGMAGYAVVGLFAVTWAVAAAAWRVAGLEKRWAVADRGG
jgi:high-affinity nickel-transport protein